MAFTRRYFLSSTSISALMSMSGAALAQAPVAKPVESKPEEAPEWSSPAKDLPKDADPLKDELMKYPRCRYCGMHRTKFSHTRMLLAFDDEGVDATCSLHCAAISLSLQFRHGPKAFYVGDFGATEEIKPLIPAETAFYVIDPSKPGTMTKISKAAYSDRAKAEAEASAKAGARVVDFHEALKAAYTDLGGGISRALIRRGEARQKKE